MTRFSNQLAFSGPVFLIFLVFLTGCQEKLSSLESYYFPLSELEDGLVYVYSPVQNLNVPDDVWFYKSVINGDGVSLVGQSYDDSLNVKQLSIMSPTSMGVVLDTLILFLQDSTGFAAGTVVDIKRDALFPYFIPDTSHRIIQSMIWVDPNNMLEYTFQKVRRFAGFEKVEIEGSLLDVAVFEVTVDLETFWEHDGTTNTSWPEVEYYALGIGLVKYVRALGPETKIEYQLVGRYPMEKFLMLN